MPNIKSVAPFLLLFSLECKFRVEFDNYNFGRVTLSRIMMHMLKYNQTTKTRDMLKRSMISMINNCVLI